MAEAQALKCESCGAPLPVTNGDEIRIEIDKGVVIDRKNVVIQCENCGTEHLVDKDQRGGLGQTVFVTVVEEGGHVGSITNITGPVDNLSF